MEQHPIPQDITGFKFKLVGDMTLKQFGELAGGAIIAYLFYASSWHPLLKWPLVAFFSFLGIALAFLPIEERPLDIWIINFLKAIYRPTLLVWKKDSPALAYVSGTPGPVPPAPTPQPTAAAEPQPALAPWPYGKEPEEKPKLVEEPEKEKLEEMTTTIKEEKATGAAPEAQPPAEPEVTVAVPTSASQPTPPPAPTPAEQAEPAVPAAPVSIDGLQKLRDAKLKELEEAKVKAYEVLRQETPTPQPTPALSGHPYEGKTVLTVEDLTKLREQKTAEKDDQRGKEISEGEEKLSKLQEQSKQLQIKIDELKTKTAGMAVPDAATTSEMEALTQEKEKLTTEILALQESLSAARVEPLTRPAYQQPRSTDNPAVRIVQKPVEPSPTISLTDMPNVINGMVVNEKNMPLDGVIVVIKDKTGNAIRALKTNKTGQFMISTPLGNGTYYLEMEKQGFGFDVLEVTLSGEVLKPLEITARTMAASS